MMLSVYIVLRQGKSDSKCLGKLGSITKIFHRNATYMSPPKRNKYFLYCLAGLAAHPNQTKQLPVKTDIEINVNYKVIS